MDNLRQNTLVTWDLKRLEWLLLGLVTLLLLLIMVLALLVFSERSQRLAGADAAESQRQALREESRVRQISSEPVTAESTYAAGLELARAWAADAQLWQGQATWSKGSDFESSAPGWVYTFYSPSRREMALVNAAPGTVARVRTEPVTRQPSLVSADKWQIDSQTAVDLLLRSGGRAFLFTHEEASMMLTLRTDGQLRWQASLIDESERENGEGQATFQIEFDAVNGHLIAGPSS